MYSIIALKNNIISMHWSNSQNECYDIVEKIKCEKHKIYSPSNQKNLFFLSALEWDNSISDFKLNIDKAKEIKKSQIREIRSILFQKLDLAFMKAIELGDEEKKKYIILLKNKFRDVTTIELPSSEEDLLNFSPQVFEEVYNLSI